MSSTSSAASRTPVPVGPTREDLAFDHGAISRFNVWFFTSLVGYINHITSRHKSRAFAGITANDVLEIGAGTGANIAFLPQGTHLYAVEPSLRMHEGLLRRCERAGIDVTVIPTGAQVIPLPSASVDEVICSLVLCTVPDADAVLAEIRRVLRPGGQFRFVEHVAAPEGTFRAWVQVWIRRPWGWLFEGCDPHRETLDSIFDSGFRSVRYERRKLRHSLFWNVNTAVWGIAAR